VPAISATSGTGRRQGSSRRCKWSSGASSSADVPKRSAAMSAGLRRVTTPSRVTGIQPAQPVLTPPRQSA